ncbi:DUF418 domain-containing protein [Microbacterium sp. APC 3898]|uniref:DUF418 domain-containing protein n=2 Tax=Planococcus TaxID=1372 RepID=A0ABT7ZFL6_9BACL|nr:MULTISPECIES: DUF418 domain-containing protein [Terrabacteria group]MBD8013617.1 DUF418 domain-containing protein [Planococcus wigleyi]MBF6632563.1 DUF418 domain-containing protein [Planococcus sp. (in: firmicutes)]MDN3425919.1 DUF418 domain-containing protein [Planococcus sp. APC 4016]MDN3497616.1 DUF418 domain-containing protein [Microbacterium sp. APC 3898]
MDLQPVSINERVKAIDLMRGFALLGILIINMLAFHSPLSYIDPYKWFNGSLNEGIYMVIDIFIQASFYPLFAMLFGYGLAMQFMRAEARNRPFMPLAVKRLLILLLIGIIHAFLIWYGDILITYAIMGLLLISMIRLPSAWLMAFAAVIYTVPHLLLLGIMFLAVAVDPNTYVGYMEIESSIQSYQSGSFAEIFSQRLADWTYSNNLVNYIVLIATILPFLMVGAAAAKWRLIERTQEKRKLWLVLAIVPLTVGLLLKSAPFLFESNYAFVYLQDIFGGPLVAIGYAALIALLAQNAFMQKLLSPLAKVGRMSLTTYITQSVLATLIFYSYGFGLYGQVDLLTGTLIALGIFIGQVIFAELWFEKFQRGPLEIIWRNWTYGNKFEKTNNSKL